MADDDIEFRTSRRAARMRIDVSARQGVVVVVPQGTPQPTVERFVAAKRGWIRRARDRVAADAAVGLDPNEPAVPDTLDLRALERTVTVEVVEGQRRRTMVPTRGAGDRLRVAAGSPAEIRAALAAWLKGETRRRLVPRLDALAEHHGLSYERAAVRGQRTRWASCSGRGTISLNFRLLFLPPPLADHVLLHELAHTRHLNHSQRFWNLLAQLDPDWRGHDAALRRAREWIPRWVELDG